MESLNWESLDWEDLQGRLRGMLSSALALGLAGLAAGALIYGLDLRQAYRYGPRYYRAFGDPGILADGLRQLVTWLYDGSSWIIGLVFLLWAAGALWVYLLPEVPRGRRLRGLAGALGGLLLAFGIDKVAGRWGEWDLWVRFGVLLGSGTFLGLGLVLRERGRVLLGRMIRGGISGGYISLVYAFGAEIGLLGYAAGFSPAVRTMVPPAVCGLVIGLTLRGGELLLSGPVFQQWRRYWPLILLALVVLVNAVGPVLLVQYWYLAGRL
ncbi:MAG: hypothetical protein WDA75_10910 [Candidatus Latescibacterota bacterium]|jgi:hypothetical protein